MFAKRVAAPSCHSYCHDVQHTMLHIFISGNKVWAVLSLEVRQC